MQQHPSSGITGCIPCSGHYVPVNLEFTCGKHSYFNKYQHVAAVLAIRNQNAFPEFFFLLSKHPNFILPFHAAFFYLYGC